MSLTNGIPHPRVRVTGGAPRAGTLCPSAADRILVLAPHPDDETLAAGGLLHAASEVGAAVRVCYLTDGENNPWAQLVVQARWPFRAADRAAWGRRRRSETLNALACLGVPQSGAAFLGFPDQGLTDLLLGGNDAPARSIEDAIRAWRPTTLVVPSLGDDHPDHSAVSVLTTIALARLEPAQRPRRVLRYRVHGREAPGTQALSLALDRRSRERKRAAVLCHRSQLAWHRRDYLEFVGRSESFEEDGDGALSPGRRAPRGSLHVLFESEAGVRQTIEIDRPRRATSERDLVELALSAARATSVKRHEAGDRLRWCFVLLDQRAKRRLGFHDSTWWLEAKAPESAKAIPLHGETLSQASLRYAPMGR
jgi:LmbE family N-acetylglucosaminyl deacetylase